MTGAAEERFLRIYCPTHKTTFTVAGERSILCESGGESLAKDFPFDSSWEFCCVCRTYWPVDLFRSGKARAECPVCNRRVAERYLCDACNLLSLEPDAPASQKRFTLSPNGGPQPPCPGCLAAVKPVLYTHHCGEGEVEFVTPRHSCPFCEAVIVKDVPKGPPPETVSWSSPAPPRVSQATGPRPLGGESPAAGDPLKSPAQSDLEKAAKVAEAKARAAAAKQAAGERPAPPQPRADAPGKRSKKIVIFGAIVAAIVVAYTAAVILRVSPREPEGNANTRPTPAPPPTGMAYVPGGEFMMGRDDGDEFERPRHKVTVKPFFIDLYETTCEEYEKFVRATGHKAPVGWRNGSYPEGWARRPVTGVNWDDAVAYADWAGKRLPTEEEWEFAARGVDGRLYPWGNQWNSDAANADVGSPKGTVDVGAHPSGQSAYGAFDMAGNAWEWTASDFNAYPGGQQPADLPSGIKVIRGGSWRELRVQVTTTYRGNWPARGSNDYSGTGFRCVKDVPGGAATR